MARSDRGGLESGLKARRRGTWGIIILSILTLIFQAETPKPVTNFPDAHLAEGISHKDVHASALTVVRSPFKSVDDCVPAGRRPGFFPGGSRRGHFGGPKIASLFPVSLPLESIVQVRRLSREYFPGRSCNGCDLYGLRKHKDTIYKEGSLMGIILCFEEYAKRGPPGSGMSDRSHSHFILRPLYSGHKAFGVVPRPFSFVTPSLFPRFCIQLPVNRFQAGAHFQARSIRRIQARWVSERGNAT